MIAPSVLPAERILDEQGPLMEVAQSQRAEVDVPFAIVNLDESHVFLAQGLTDVDPLLVPADAAVAADPTDLVSDRDTPGVKGGTDRAANWSLGARDLRKAGWIVPEVWVAEPGNRGHARRRYSAAQAYCTEWGRKAVELIGG